MITENELRYILQFAETYRTTSLNPLDYDISVLKLKNYDGKELPWVDKINLESVSFFYIENCNNLDFSKLPFKIRSLEIKQCNNLKSIQLNSEIKNLTIDDCATLEVVKGIPSIMESIYLNKLPLLPEIQNSINISHLRIYDCPKFKTIDNFTGDSAYLQIGHTGIEEINNPQLKVEDFYCSGSIPFKGIFGKTIKHAHFFCVEMNDLNFINEKVQDMAMTDVSIKSLNGICDNMDYLKLERVDIKDGFKCFPKKIKQLGLIDMAIDTFPSLEEIHSLSVVNSTITKLPRLRGMLNFQLEKTKLKRVYLSKKIMDVQIFDNLELEIIGGYKPPRLQMGGLPKLRRVSFFKEKERNLGICSKCNLFTLKNKNYSCDCHSLHISVCTKKGISTTKKNLYVPKNIFIKQNPPVDCPFAFEHIVLSDYKNDTRSKIFKNR